MITITGTVSNAAGTPYKATIEFAPRSTPIVGGGIVINGVPIRVTAGSDGTFSQALAPGNYEVTVTVLGTSNSFCISVPAGSGALPIDQVITTALAFTYVAPGSVISIADPVNTVYNADGSITETYTRTGQVATTTFPSNGSIVKTFGAPISQVLTITFDNNGNETQTLT